MITSFDKAIAAALGLIIWVMNTYFGISFGIDEVTLNGLVAAITPLLVFLIPNKKQPTA
jgi:hypothetical protein